MKTALLTCIGYSINWATQWLKNSTTGRQHQRWGGVYWLCSICGALPKYLAGFNNFHCFPWYIMSIVGKQDEKISGSNFSLSHLSSDYEAGPKWGGALLSDGPGLGWRPQGVVFVIMHFLLLDNTQITFSKFTPGAEHNIWTLCLGLRQCGKVKYCKQFIVIKHNYGHGPK